MRPAAGLLLTMLFTASTGHGAEPDPAAWERVLTEHVTAAGEVDFACLRRDRDDLDAYVAYVAEVSPASHPQRFPDRDAVLAYHINAYNALAMHNVLEFDTPEKLAGFFFRVRFFYLRKQRIGGRRISLYHYENDVIRPLGEPRVHFALNCMAASCPRLPKQPFTAARLDADLERVTREFFAEPRNLFVDHDQRRIRVSEILDFYQEDFLAGHESLAAYVDRYTSESIPAGYQTSFFDYDWTVNAAPSSRCQP